MPQRVTGSVYGVHRETAQTDRDRVVRVVLGSASPTSVTASSGLVLSDQYTVPDQAGAVVVSKWRSSCCVPMVLSRRHQPALHRLREPHPHVAVTKISVTAVKISPHHGRREWCTPTPGLETARRHAGHQPGTHRLGRRTGGSQPGALVEGERGEDLTEWCTWWKARGPESCRQT